MAAKQTRMQMVPGSVWRFTQDADIIINIANPAYEKARSAFWNAQPPHGSGIRRASFDEMRQHVEQTLGLTETIEFKKGSVKAGETFEITGKSSSHSSYYLGADNGLIFPVKYNGKEHWLPYKVLEPISEIETAVVVRAFALRDTATGRLFKEIEYGKGWNPIGTIWVDAYTKSKRWADLNKLRLWIMGKTGYYDGMPGSENMPDWAGGRKELTVEPTWEIVEFDKLTKTEVAVHDLQTWFTRLWELRDLTIKFGSPVRKLYNDLDKKGTLDGFKGMLVARMPVHDHVYNGQLYSRSYDGEELDPADVAAIDEAIKHSGIKKTEIRRAKDKHCVAIAFSTVSQAMMLKLSYTGNLKLSAINLETLKETVEEANG